MTALYIAAAVLTVALTFGVGYTTGDRDGNSEARRIFERIFP